MTFKHIAYLAVPLALMGAATSCDHDEIFEQVEFSVQLSSANTYVAGQPVVFDFGGNADYITVWNGDTGHEYRYRERTSVSMEDIESCELSLEIGQQWGPADQTSNLDILAGNRFDGLSGTDAAADRPLVESIDADRSEWDVLDYTVAPRVSAVDWQTQSYDITPYAENFAWALYLHAAADQPMRFYYINPKVTVKFKGYDTQVHSYSKMSFVSFSLAERHAEDPYIHNVPGNGNPKFQGLPGHTVATGQISFQGGNAGDLGAIRQWIFMQPFPLNTIAPDQGTNIKGVVDDVRRYEHTYNTPGTYTATFIVSTGNYQGESERVVREVTFTVVERIG